jgi:hypothetical protein
VRFTGLRFFRCCWMTSHTVTGSTPMMAATATGPHHIRGVSHLADHSVGWRWIRRSRFGAGTATGCGRLNLKKPAKKQIV